MFWQFSSRIAMEYSIKQADFLDPKAKANFLAALEIPVF
jgi:hypothetical protein